ncbi:MAG: ABC transporter ATP-binding protein [Saprospiraceae bacterium]|nr:ABC transporter ATP-binding protein [Saprospiraceae bacterium]
MTLKSILGLFENVSNANQSGSITYRDEDSKIELVNASIDNMKVIRKNRIGLVFQQSSQVLNPSHKIGVQVGERIKESNSKNSLKQKVLDCLIEVELDHPEIIYNKYPHELSGGQLQRVLIAIGIIAKPELLLIDEPTSALDAELKIKIMDLIKRLCSKYNVSVLLVSHNMHLISDYSHYIIVIDDGVIQEYGSTQQLLSNPQSDVTKLLLRKNTFKEAKQQEVGTSVIIETKNLSHSFKIQNGIISKKSMPVLKDLNVQLFEGEFLGVVGKSGSGKSTLGKIMAGLLQPTYGDVLFKGHSIFEMSNNEFDIYNKTVQIIFQDPLSSLTPHRNGKEVLEEAINIANAQAQFSDLQSYLSQFSLPEDILSKTPKQMSGGQRQRLAIARALIFNPQVLICDEILSSLDTPVQANIMSLIFEMKRLNELSVIFISHDIALIEQFSNRIIEIENLH